MAGLKTIVVYPEDIDPKAKFMLDNKGRLDLLGQILVIGFNIKVHERIRSPAHMNCAISPFSVWARDHAHNTELTIKLLQNSHLSGYRQVKLANTLLEPHNIYLEIDS